MPVCVGLITVSWAECKAACRLHLTILNRRNIGTMQRKLALGLHTPYCASGTPSGICSCANKNPTESCSSPGAPILVRALLLLAYTKPTLSLIGCL